MIIIFEGPDRTGKTNIAKRLSEVLEIPYFKFEMESQIFNQTVLGNHNKALPHFLYLLRYGFPLLVEFLRQTKTDVILDRSYPSEIVYSKVYQRETDSLITDWADSEFARMGALIILCYKDHVIEPDDIIAPEFYDSIKEEYLKLDLKVPIVKLNTTDQDLDRQINYIGRMIRENNTRRHAVLGDQSGKVSRPE